MDSKLIWARYALNTATASCATYCCYRAQYFVVGEGIMSLQRQ